MPSEIVPIRSIQQYIKEFGYDALVVKRADRGLVKKQIMDAFEKEIFGQLMLRYKDVTILSRPEEEIDEKTRLGVRHILSNSKWKWKRLCSEFSKYRETRDLIYPDELMLNLQDIVKILEKDRESPSNNSAEAVIDDTPVEVVVSD